MHNVRNLWKLLMSYRDHAPVWHYSFLKDGIFDTDAFRALLLSIFVFTIFFVWCIFYSESIRIHWWCTPIGTAKSFRHFRFRRDVAIDSNFRAFFRPPKFPKKQIAILWSSKNQSLMHFLFVENLSAFIDDAHPSAWQSRFGVASPSRFGWQRSMDFAWQKAQCIYIRTVSF